MSRLHLARNREALAELHGSTRARVSLHLTWMGEALAKLYGSTRSGA